MKFFFIQPIVDSLGTGAGEAASVQEETLSVIELIGKVGLGGGIILAILAILSIITVYIFIEKYLAIRKAAKEDTTFMNTIRDFIAEDRVDAAKSLCKNTNGPFARMIEKGVSRIGKPLSDISTAIENVGRLELFKLESNLPTLATIAGAAPMIGFLGTVLGMIIAFHSMASAGGNIDVEILAEGIYSAMVTTVGGLIVGIVAFVAYNSLVAKVEKVVNRMEALTTEFLDLLHKPNSGDR